jgi:hypothetical protein
VVGESARPAGQAAEPQREHYFGVGPIAPIQSLFVDVDQKLANGESEEAKEHFGWFTQFSAMKAQASSRWTRERLGWQPKGPGLIADIDRPTYFDS